MQYLFLTFLCTMLLFSREVPPNAKIQGRLNIINGASAECVMHKFYTGTGWKQIEGEIGRNGIDGLYYKEKYGNIKEVLVAESKWNKSRLGPSGKGKTVKQMSQEWVLKTMDKLVNRLHARIYKNMRELIQHDQYRARLFRLKPVRGNAIQITIYKIKNKGAKAFDESIESKLKPMKIMSPRNSFETKMVNAYNTCRDHYLHKYLGEVLTDSEIQELLQDNYIKKKDVVKMIERD